MVGIGSLEIGGVDTTAAKRHRWNNVKKKKGGDTKESGHQHANPTQTAGNNAERHVTETHQNEGATYPKVMIPPGTSWIPNGIRQISGPGAIWSCTPSVEL